MKSSIFSLLTASAVASITMFGCASSTETASSDMSMSSTSAAGGYASDMNDNQLNVLVVEEQVMVPVATVAVTALALENTMDVDDMFEDIGDTEQYTTWELAKTSPNLSTFVQLVQQAGLEDDLQRVENLTIFAPTNAAFAQMPREKLETLVRSDNTAALSSMLQAHFLTSDISSAVLEDNNRISVSDRSYITIDRGNRGEMTRIGGAQLVKTDIESSNGRIHVIDKVILPSEDFQEMD
ncbi:MAG: fasciclin domain-containing protein [Rufibacter sp.]